MNGDIAHYRSESLTVGCHLLLHLESLLVLRRVSGLRPWTNLIAKDRLLEIFEKLEDIFADLNVISRQKQLLLFGQRPQLFLD